MQRPHEAKRKAIVESAAELFASRPFHEVRLDDIAEAAHVGKGTLYTYFKSKDDLYGSLVLQGFTELVERVKAETSSESGSAWGALSSIIRQLVSWARGSPHVFQLMRHGQQNPPIPGLREKRQELARLIEATIARGVRRGELVDPHPVLTAQFILSSVRGALRFGPPNVGQETLTNQLLHILRQGIQRKKG